MSHRLLALVLSILVAVFMAPRLGAQSNSGGLTVTLNAKTFAPGDTMVVTAALAPLTPPRPVDAYITVQIPNGTMMSLQLGGGLVGGVVPIAQNIVPFLFEGVLAQYTFSGTEPVGTYTWYVALTERGTVNPITPPQQVSFGVGISAPIAAVASVQPTAGVSGTLVRVGGENFTDGSVVSFGGIRSRTYYVSETELAAYVPFASSGGVPSPLQAHVAEVTVDGGPGKPFVVTVAATDPTNPGQVLREGLSSLSSSVASSQTELLSLLTEAAEDASTTDEAQLYEAVRRSIAPAQVLLAELGAAAHDLDAATGSLFDATINGQRSPEGIAESLVLADGNGAPIAAPQALVAGDQWLEERLALLEEQRTLRTVTDGILGACAHFQFFPPAEVFCEFAELTLAPIKLLQDFRLAKYGLIVGLQFTVDRPATIESDQVKIEAYPGLPVTVSARLLTQKQSRLMDPVLLALKVLFRNGIRLASADRSRFSEPTRAAMQELLDVFPIFEKLIDSVGKLITQHNAPVTELPVSFHNVALKPNYPIAFSLFDPGCVVFLQNRIVKIAQTGEVSVPEPLSTPASCPYGVISRFIAKDLEGGHKVALTVFTPHLHVSTDLLALSATEGQAPPPARSFTIENRIEPRSNERGSPDIQWTAEVMGGSLPPGRVLLSRTNGMMINGDVTVNVVSAGLAPGSYDATIRVAAPQLNGSPKSVKVSLTVDRLCLRPAVPTGLFAQGFSGHVEVRWNGVPGATSYVVQAGSTQGASDIFDGNVGASTAVSSPVPAGFSAFVRVAASNACGISAPTADFFVTTPDATNPELSNVIGEWVGAITYFDGAQFGVNGPVSRPVRLVFCTAGAPCPYYTNNYQHLLYQVFGWEGDGGAGIRSFAVAGSRVILEGPCIRWIMSVVGRQMSGTAYSGQCLDPQTAYATVTLQRSQ